MDNFHFLNDVESSSKKSYPPEIKLKGLQKMYAPVRNVYNLKGLNSNVPECIGDSSSTGIIGGSFLEHKSDNKAVYDGKIVRGVKYHFLLPFQKAIAINESNGIYGFRLAMDRVGSVQYDCLRKRRYRFKSNR